MKRLFYVEFFLIIVLAISCTQKVNAVMYDNIVRYSPDDPKILSLITGEFDMSDRRVGFVMENLFVGSWKEVPYRAGAASTSMCSPYQRWHSIEFTKNGVVKIHYSQLQNGKAQDKGEFIGTYKFLPTANKCNMLIMNLDKKNARVNVLHNIRISMFWSSADYGIMNFRDPDGYLYAFIADQEALSVLWEASKREMEITKRKQDEMAAKAIIRHMESCRIPDRKLTEQAIRNLQSGTLTDHERNKEILRLMNEGDETCVPVLLEHLKADHSLVVRQNTIRALGKVGDKRAVPSLLDILRAPVQGRIEDEGESEAIFRREAVLALGDIGDPSALAMLRAIAEAAREYQSVRDFARIATRKLECQ